MVYDCSKCGEYEEIKSKVYEEIIKIYDNKPFLSKNTFLNIVL